MERDGRLNTNNRWVRSGYCSGGLRYIPALDPTRGDRDRMHGMRWGMGKVMMIFRLLVIAPENKLKAQNTSIQDLGHLGECSPNTEYSPNPMCALYISGVNPFSGDAVPMKQNATYIYNPRTLLPSSFLLPAGRSLVPACHPANSYSTQPSWTRYANMRGNSNLA